MTDEDGECQTIEGHIEKTKSLVFKESVQLMLNFLQLLIVLLCFVLVADEESTIEEQEEMEGEADHKAELMDLAKDGTYVHYCFYRIEIYCVFPLWKIFLG